MGWECTLNLLVQVWKRFWDPLISPVIIITVAGRHSSPGTLIALSHSHLVDKSGRNKYTCKEKTLVSVAVSRRILLLTSLRSVLLILYIIIIYKERPYYRFLCVLKFNVRTPTSKTWWRTTYYWWLLPKILLNSSFQLNWWWIMNFCTLTFGV